MSQVARQCLWKLPGLRGLHRLPGQRVHRYLSGCGALQGSSIIHSAAWAKDAANVRPVLQGVRTVENTSLRLVSTSSHHQHSNTDSAERQQAGIQQHEDHLSLSVGGQTFRASFLWLRDHCKCPTCYEHSCKQNFVDIISLPDDIRPKQFSAEDDTLTITWLDDHITTFSLQWLLQNAPGQRLYGQVRGQMSWKEVEGQRLQEQDEGESDPSSLADCQQLQPFLWDCEALELNSPQDVHIDALREGEGLRCVMENLHVYGFTFVSGLAPTKESTEEAIRLISSPMHTLYGDIWQYQNDAEIADTGYTSLPLKNHTDCTYFNHAAGGLVLHCIHHDGTGGENTLVDGFHAAQRLRETDPDLYATLLTYPVEAHYLDPTHDFRCQHTVLQNNALSNQLQQLRFNPHDRSDLTYLSYEDTQRFYEAYRALGRIIESPENELRTELQPGRMVVFDNFRLLHGRASFSGNRVMVGCYFIHDELQNLKRSSAGIEV